RDAEQGQSNLFGMLHTDEAPEARVERVAAAPEWGEGERLGYEKESLGFFITGHPLERFRSELQQWATATTATLADKASVPPLSDKASVPEGSVGGIITALRFIKTKKGDRMASFVLEDLEGSAEVLVFPETYKKTAARLADDQLVLVKGKPEVLDEGQTRLLASDVLALEQAKLAEARYVTIR